MKKLLSVWVLALLMFVGAPSVFSASDRCVVKKADGNTVVLECNKKSDNFKVDDKVKIKSSRKKSVEGC